MLFLWMLKSHCFSEDESWIGLPNNSDHDDDDNNGDDDTDDNDNYFHFLGPILCQMFYI